MAGSTLDREQYKVAIPQLSAKLNELLDKNVIINRTVINLSNGKVSDLNSYLGYFQNLATGYFEAIAGDVQYLTSREAYINHLKADIAGFGYLTAETADLRYATITNLYAATARIGALETDHVSVTDLNAAKGRISDLEADHVSTTDLAATNAEVDHIKVGDLTIGGVTVNIYDLAVAIKNSAMASGTTWYKVSATTPSAPTAFDPTSVGWSQIEPSYTGGTTDSLYSCLRVVYADDDPTGTRHFQWSDVHKIQPWEAAKEAYAYAGDANDYAEQAKTAADTAMKGLGQVEDVVGTLNWITEHSSVTEDTTPTAGKSYYIKNQDGTFTLVTDVEGKNPAQEGWYELTEAVQNYILSHLALANEGLYVMKDGSAWKVNIADDGIYILDPNNNSVNQMAADGNLIGYEDETHAKIDYHSLQLIGRGDLTPYFWASDLRDKDDDYQATLKETFYGDGYTTEFDVSLVDVTEEVSAVDHSNPSNTARRRGYTYVFTNPPARNSLVEITYKTKSFMAKAYTFGLRDNSGFIGALSVAEGLYNSAWGFASHAEGRDTGARGYCSHSEGRGTLAGGEASHAQNKGTVTRQDYQTAIGKYNDNQQNNAFEIGNGTNDSNRSNAFEVDWSGNVNASGDVEDGQGNVLADKLDSSGIFDLIYPVGSYYWTSDGNFSPANTFGGTWEKIDAGVTLVSAGTGYTVQSGTAKDGGNDEITLTDKQMAHGHTYTRPTVVSGEGGHTHTVNMKYTSNATPTGTGQSQPRANGTSTSSGFASIPANSGTHNHTLTGGGVADLAGASSTREAFDNMPPYKAAYCWHRTA